MSNNRPTANGLTLNVTGIGSFANGLGVVSNSCANIGDNSAIVLSGNIRSGTALSVQAGTTFTTSDPDITLSSDASNATYNGVDISISNIDLCTGSSIIATEFSRIFGILPGIRIHPEG